MDVAVVISGCYDYTKAAIQLTSGLWPRLMNLILTKLIVSAVMTHKAIYRTRFNLESFNRFHSLRQYDDAFIIKLFGFKTTDDYYREATNAYGLERIAVPTFALSAADDLIAPQMDLPLEQVARCGSFTMLVTERGGHIGFIDGILKPGFFLERLFEQFAGALFGLKSNPRELFQEKSNQESELCQA